VLGTVAANLLAGDPVWLLLVGSPASGKTEILQAIGSLAHVHATATLTEAGLLSGTPKREKDKAASGGLLRTIGDFGIVLCKDFGSVLSLHHDARAQVLAALREVYDGSWTRVMGTDGGKTLHWEGKLGLIAGCTPTIDRHAAVMGAMGERFVLLRLHGADAHQQASKALKHAKRSGEMRAELGSAISALFDRELIEPEQRSERDEERLVKLAVLVVRCRSAVERDGVTREIELVPEPEAPARLVIVLDRLLAGLLALGADEDTAWHVVEAAALDSIPALRRKTMLVLLDAIGEMRTADVSEAIGYPLRTTERTLEDLTAHGVADVNRYGQGKATTWQISRWTGENYAAATSPEKSEGVFSNSLCTHTNDLSGEVGGAAATAPSASGDETPALTADVGADGTPMLSENDCRPGELAELEVAAASFTADGRFRGEPGDARARGEGTS
jgi:DNA-binding transcriptional ArsR family regulator